MGSDASYEDNYQWIESLSSVQRPASWTFLDAFLSP